MNIQIGDNVFRNFFKVTLVFVRNQNSLNPPTMRRQQFFLQTADWQHLAAQGDFPCHRHIGAYRVTGQAGNQRGAHRRTGARTIFWRCPFRYVHVNIAFFVEVRIDTELLSTRAYHGQRCLN